jgi:hypothetical protein
MASANADFPLAVGPAIRMALLASVIRNAS